MELVSVFAADSVGRYDFDDASIPRCCTAESPPTRTHQDRNTNPSIKAPTPSCAVLRDDALRVVLRAIMELSRGSKAIAAKSCYCAAHPRMYEGL